MNKALFWFRGCRSYFVFVFLAFGMLDKLSRGINGYVARLTIIFPGRRPVYRQIRWRGSFFVALYNRFQDVIFCGWKKKIKKRIWVRYDGGLRTRKVIPRLFLKLRSSRNPNKFSFQNWDLLKWRNDRTLLNV